MNGNRIVLWWRKAVWWLLPAVFLLFVIYRLKFVPVAVLEHPVVNGPVTAEVMGTGTLEARVGATVSAKIQGLLVAVLADQGDHVASGQLLARLDDSELRQQVEVAQATLAAVRATVERLRTDEARARAIEKQAVADYQRTTELRGTGVASLAEFDKATEQLDTARAELQRAQAATVEAERQTVAAQKNLAYQQERLANTRVLAPFDGLVTRRDREAGDIVVPGGAIVEMISTNEIWISAWVDETALAALAVGQPARIIFRSEPDRVYSGEVARLGRQTDRETRELLVDVGVQQLPRNWTVGQRAEVFIETARKDQALSVPSRFIQWREGRPGAYVKSAGKARWRALATGLRGVESVEVSQGLSSGEVVVVPRGSSRQPLEGRKVAAR